VLRENPGADEYARATYLMPDLTSLDRSRSQSFVRQQTRRLDPQLYVGIGNSGPWNATLGVGEPHVGARSLRRIPRPLNIPGKGDCDEAHASGRDEEAGR
jgi:hypothetical protein